MSNVIFACRFEIESDDGINASLKSYCSWIQNHYRLRRKMVDFSFDPADIGRKEGLPPSHELTLDVVQNDTNDVAVISWDYRDDQHSGVSWLNHIRIGAFESFCSIEHVVSVRSIEYSIYPINLSVGSPRIVRQLCIERPAFIAGMRVTPTPYQLNKGNFEKFLQLLNSKDRHLPILFLSPYANGDANLIDAEISAKRLSCVAVVVEVKDPDVTWMFADTVGRQIACFDGGARIYWPRFLLDNRPSRHPLYLGSRISIVGPEKIISSIERVIFSIAAFRFVPDPRITSVLRSVEEKVRATRLEQKKSSGETDWEQYALEIDEKLSNANQKLIELEAENTNLKANQLVFLGLKNEEDMDSGDNSEARAEKADSVIDAVRLAQIKTKNIIYLETALESALDSPFVRPAEILEALKDLDSVAGEWLQKKRATGTAFDPVAKLKELGWRRASMHISDTTIGTYGSKYTFNYNGQKKLFAPHITIGSGDPNNCASIHYIIDEEKLKFVVAHVGRHLPNTKT